MQCIQSELLKCLKNGCYSKIYNYPFNDFDNTVKLDEDQDVHLLEDEEVRIIFIISHYCVLTIHGPCDLFYVHRRKICTLNLMRSKQRWMAWKTLKALLKVKMLRTKSDYLFSDD